jgi:probable HAF family extracellular repeat protein
VWWSAATAVVFLVSLASPAAATRATGWQVVDIGVGDDSIANAVNARGHVVGQQSGRSFLWRDGRHTDLGIDGFSFAEDINNGDEVVGSRIIGDGTGAFLWRHGQVVDIGTLPGGSNSSAQAVNDRGEVVGWSEISGGGIHAFHWYRGVLTDLGAGGQRSIAYDIDNAGRVVGTVDDGAVSWWRGRVSALHSGTHTATAISRSGAITGRGMGVSGLSAGFVQWRGGYVVIPQPPDELGTPFLEPAGINSRRQVVGSSSVGAFVWERGRTTILPALTRAAFATDINDLGVVVGANPSSSDGTKLHAVLWIR